MRFTLAAYTLIVVHFVLSRNLSYNIHYCRKILMILFRSMFIQFATWRCQSDKTTGPRTAVLKLRSWNWSLRLRLSGVSVVSGSAGRLHATRKSLWKCVLLTSRWRYWPFWFGRRSKALKNNDARRRLTSLWQLTDLKDESPCPRQFTVERLNNLWPHDPPHSRTALSSHHGLGKAFKLP